MGRKQTEKTKKKVSESLKARYASGLKNGFLGKKHSKKSKKKMSESHKLFGEDNPFYGKKHTEESKKKMSESLKGRKLSQKTKQKMKIAHTGKKSTNETKEKLRVLNLGDRNPNWKGDDVGYGGVHNWIKNNLVRPKRCQRCKKVKRLDVANVSGKYKRRLNDWIWLCRRCHLIIDTRMFRNLKQFH